MSSFYKITRSKVFIVGAALVFLGLLGAEYNQVSKMRAVEKEIADLKKQDDYYNKLNQQMKDSISSYDSQFFKEKVAREQLNLKKQGEQVYSYTTTEEATAQEQQAENQDQNPALKESNPKKWWNYFFNQQI